MPKEGVPISYPQVEHSVTHKRAVELYNECIGLLLGSDQGSFETKYWDYFDEVYRYGNLGISVVNPDHPKKAVIELLWQEEKGRQKVKYTLDSGDYSADPPNPSKGPPDPGNLSAVPRAEVLTPNTLKGWWRRVSGFVPRTVVDDAEIDFLNGMVEFAVPTRGFAERLQNDAGKVFSFEERVREAISDLEEENARIVSEKLIRRANEDASKLREQLKAVNGPKCLALIVEDFQPKVERLEAALRVESEIGNLAYVPHWEKDGEEALRFFEAFKTNGYPGTKIVVFLDGHLKGRYETNLKVARQFLDLCTRNGFLIPYFVGESSDGTRNESLRKVLPEQYLGSFEDEPIGVSVSESTQLFKSIRARLAMDSIKQDPEKLLKRAWVISALGDPDSFELTPEMVQLRVEELNLSTRLFNALKRSNVRTIYQILGMDKDTLLAVRQLGKESLNELADRIATLCF